MSVYVCICMCTSVYMCVTVCVCTHVHVCMRGHVCTCHGWGSAIREQPQVSVLTFPFLLGEAESGYLAPEVLEKPYLCLPFPPGTLGLQMFALQHLLLHRFWDGNSGLQARTARAFTTEPAFLVICYFTLHCLTQHSKLL